MPADLLYQRLHRNLIRLLLVLLPVWVQAEHYPSRNLGTREGLSSSTVYQCFQDSRHFMWFATESGVNRYDGSIVESFTLDEGLTDVEVFSIFEDSKGRIWFSTYNGIPCFYQDGHIHNPGNDPYLRGIRMNGFIRRVVEDNTGNIWLIGSAGDLLALRPGGKHLVLHNPSPILEVYRDSTGELNVVDSRGMLSVVRNNTLQAVRTLGKGNGRFVWYCAGALYFTGSDGLYRFDGRTETPVIRDERFSQNKVISLFMHAAGKRLWVGTTNGVYVFSLPAMRQLYWLKKSEIASSIVLDHEQNFWISSMEHGVFFYPAYWESIMDPGPGMLLSDNVKAITSNDDDLLIGFADGTIQVLDSIPMRISLDAETLGDRSRIKDLVLRQDTLYVISDRTFAIATRVRHDTPWKVIYSKGMSCKDIAFTPDGAILIVSASGILLYRYNAETRSFTETSLVVMNQVATSCIVSGTKALFAVHEHLYELDYVSGVYHDIPLPMRSRITDIAVAADGRYLLSTAGEGIFVVRNGLVQAHLMQDQGLSSNVCKRIYAGDANDFWVITYNGLDHLQPRTSGQFGIRNYGPEIGIPDNGLECFHLVPGAHILVGSDQGLLVVNMNRIPERAPKPLLRVIKTQSSGREYKPSESITLAYRQAAISVTLRGITYSEKNHVVYAYRLLHDQNTADTQWVETTNPVISFLSLDAGRYILQVRCRNNNSPWSNQLEVPFRVSLPFWRNTIFFTGLLLALVAAVVWVLRRRLRRARRIQRMLEKKVNERTRELSDLYSQQEHIHREKDDFIHMVAHDLRNPLTSILFSVEMLEEDLKKGIAEDSTEYLGIIRLGAERMKMLIGNLLDMSLLERGKMKISIETVYPEQICRMLLNEYQPKAAAKQMQLRYTNEVPTLGVQTDKSALTQMLDNLVSNAVKYNLPGKAIHISVQRDSDWLVVKVQDEGPGLSAEDQARLFTKFGRLQPRPTGGEDSTGIGLYIVKKLADMLQAGLSFESELGKGTTFILKLPVQRPD